MHRDHHRWYSNRLSREMGVSIYGNYGGPILAFPTSMGDEFEQEGQKMIQTLSPYIEAGRIRIFCINGVQSDSFSNKGAHPFHRSWMQAQYDAYVANEVFPFIDDQCKTPGIGIATLGASLGAYHAANTLFKHPDHVKRCYALSGVYDLRSVGKQRSNLSNVRDPKESRYCTSSGRLGTGRRPRLALLASPDVGVRRPTLLIKRSVSPTNSSPVTCHMSLPRFTPRATQSSVRCDWLCAPESSRREVRCLTGASRRR